MNLDASKKFRSCYKDDVKYSVGEFVFIDKPKQSAAKIARIDMIYDRGSKWGVNRLVAEVTWFLRKGEVKGLRLNDKELILDNRDGQDKIVIPTFMRDSCQVNHSNDSSSHGYYYTKSYDGKRVSTLKPADLQPKCTFEVKEKQKDSLMVTPIKKRRGFTPSTPGTYYPLADVTHTDNETTDSQEDDLDDLFSEKTRSQIMRRRSHKNKLSKDEDAENSKPTVIKSPRKRTLIDKDVFALDSDGSDESQIYPVKSSRVSKTVKNEHLKSENQLSTTKSKPTTRTRRSIASTRADNITAEGVRKPSRRSIAVMPSATRDKEGSTPAAPQRTKRAASERKSHNKSLSKATNLIESVQYDEFDTANSRSKGQKSPLNGDDPYDFNSDEMPSPRKKCTSFSAWKLSQSEKKSMAAKRKSTSPENKNTPGRKKLLGCLADFEDDDDLDMSVGEKVKLKSARRSRSGQDDTNPNPAAEPSQSHSKAATPGAKRGQPSAKKATTNSTSNTTTTAVAGSPPQLIIRLGEQVDFDTEPVTKPRRSVRTPAPKKTSESQKKERNSSRRTPAAKSQKEKKPAEPKSQRKPNYCLDTSLLDSDGETDQSDASSDAESCLSEHVSHRTPSSRQTPSRRAKKVVKYTGSSRPQDDDSDVDEVFNAEEENESSDSNEDPDDEVIIHSNKRGSVRKSVSSSQRKTPARKATKTASTPGRRSLAALTPSVRARQQPVRESESVLEQARAQLHVSIVPDSLPCREEEFANILSYVESKLQNKTGGCLYISGVPGTGKTATVYEVMRYLNEAQVQSSLPKYRFVEINGMRLTQPHQAFVQIYKSLMNRKVTADHATSLLDTMFSKSKKQDSIVLLVDELDLLMTRKQDVLYNLFDWPTKPDSRLIVLAIANTMDLPERVMMNRVSSRLGLNRMTFQPYTFQQLQEIVHSRLSGISAFDPDAVQLASRKVAAVSGDARRALDICRRSTEVAEAKGDAQVNMMHVDSVLQEMFSSPKITAIRNLSLYEKIVMKAIVAEFTRSGLEEATVYQVFRHIPALCAMDRMPAIKMSHVNLICTNLNNVKLALLENNGSNIYQRIRLNVSQDDVQYALRDDK